MIGYLILVVLQFAAAWYAAPIGLEYIPASGDVRVFVHAGLFAVIVWVVGLIGSFALKDVRLPSTSTLATALIGAMIGAAVIVFAPDVLHYIPLKFPPLYVPLAGALIGYFLRR